MQSQPASAAAPEAHAAPAAVVVVEPPAVEAAREVRSEIAIDPEDTSLPRGLRRFGRQLRALQTAIETATSPTLPPPSGFRRRPYLEEATVGHRLHVAGARTPLFMLQGLARIERGMRKDRAAFDELLASVKQLEDGLGEIDFWWAMLHHANGWNAPAAVRHWAETHHAHACGKLEGWLEAGAWVDHRRLPEEGTIRLRGHQLSRLLRRQEWAGRKKERRKLGAFLVDRLHRIHASALQLDMDDLEGGLHELRRKLRWVSIYAAALEGAIVLDTTVEAPAGWERYLTQEIVGSKHAKLPEADAETDPLLLPAYQFHALSWLIADLGDVKDRAQWTEALAAGLRVTGTKGEPSKWLGETALDHHVAGQHAAAVMQQLLVEDRLLLRMAEAIQEQVR